MKAILSPSLLSADLAATGLELARLERAGVTWLHLDVMDGAFVPNITFGAPFISCLRRKSRLFFDVHLMIEEPGRYLNDFAAAGADLLVIHAEATRHSQKCLAQIRDLGKKAGIALNPGTDFKALRWLLPYLDMILIMSVNPGFSGQKFIPETCAKLKALRAWLDDLNFGRIVLQVDGGACPANAHSLVHAGADVLVSGSAFFNFVDYEAAVKTFNDAMASDEVERQALGAAWEWKTNSQN